ncbi:hypothetical protein [Rhizobium sp. BK068]|uniref:hypothetical protein n=1 Tax=Rhizobium sp. BK068 TaxID=2512130 RepID=UPI0010438D6B|nr:hypothetical protein [Rhizobium sp. BK068]TCM65754.1 hypothetical protein EV291_14232 [Rhizobium sp. BK068]
MFNVFRIILVAFGLTIATSAFAIDFPFRFHHEQEIDRHQIGYVDVVIAPDGAGSVTTKFSNGKQFAGNTFAAETALLDNNQQAILVFRLVKGLDGSWGGHAREGSATSTFKLTAEQMARFNHVEVGQMRALNDGITPETWNKIWSAVGTVIQIIQEDRSPEPPQGFMHDRMHQVY